MADIHPGSFVGDSVEEFKKMPTWGKVLAVAALLGVAGYAIYQHNQANSQAATSANSANPDSSLMAGMQSPFSQVPTGNNGETVPYVPNGVNPIYDSQGNLVGWQQPASAPAPSPTPTPTPTPTPGPKPKKPPTHKKLGEDQRPHDQTPHDDRRFHTSPGHPASVNPRLGAHSGPATHQMTQRPMVGPHNTVPHTTNAGRPNVHR